MVYGFKLPIPMFDNLKIWSSVKEEIPDEKTITNCSRYQTLKVVRGFDSRHIQFAQFFSVMQTGDLDVNI
jgi:hypothetical protein